MDFKRLGSALIGLPIVALILLFGNTALISIIICLISILCMYEYLNAVSKRAKPVKWICYLSCIIIGIAGFINNELLKNILIYTIPIVMLFLFLQVIISNLKTDFQDVIYTFSGIIYVVFFLIFFVLIRKLEYGKILIWYPVIASWGTDIFAYVFGKRIGKHKFSKVSPKKSIEGCVIGTIGAIFLMVVYTIIINKYFSLNYSYFYVSIMGIFLSIIGQIGDFTESSIKRFVDIKDSGNIIPGHGGMLDRIDSMLFILPFTYILLNIFF